MIFGGIGSNIIMKEKIGNVPALYPMPLVGAMVDGKPNWGMVGLLSD